jgi:hypothetical protein
MTIRKMVFEVLKNTPVIIRGSLPMEIFL